VIQLRYLFIILLLFLFSIPTYSENAVSSNPDNKEKFSLIKVTWIDVYFLNFYPVPGTRLADFSDVNYGGGTRVNLQILGIKPLWIFGGLMYANHETNTHRLDEIHDFCAAVGGGWRFTFFDKYFLTPKFSYGIMLHAAYGDYYNEPNIYPNDSRAGTKKWHMFTDQFFHYEVEFAYDLSSLTKKFEMEVFFSPSFIHFAEKHRQGLELGYLLGVRVKSDIVSKLSKKSEPAILAGRVIDAETKENLKGTIPEITGGDAGKAALLNKETFAFNVEDDEDYTLKAEREGYKSVTYSVKKGKLNPGRRTSIILEMLRIWGIRGFVYDKETKEPIEEVNTVFQFGDGKLKDMESDDKGRVKMELSRETDYEILLKKKGYFAVRSSFTTKGKAPGWYDIKNLLWNVEFQKAKKGITIEFGNIYYDSGSYRIRKDGFPGLNKMAQFLSDNPKIKVELGAHTDSMGDANSNLTLSQKRAESAVAYLIQKGIARERVTPKGYGETKIKNKCKDGVVCSSSEHQENRRTELKILDLQ
jgi:outer membrane protein OmpA-like peptidoglycan-associated protein